MHGLLAFAPERIGLNNLVLINLALQQFIFIVLEDLLVEVLLNLSIELALEFCLLRADISLIAGAHV